MINYDLTKIKAIIFDIDGVLSAETITLSSDGVPLRTVNIKDGYAIQLAMKLGLRIVIMTGANVSSICRRYEGLGVEDIYVGCAVKIKAYDAFLEQYGLIDEEIMYMGDDIPDLQIMLSHHIRIGSGLLSGNIERNIQGIEMIRIAGGHGCGRDVIEQTLRAQGKWVMDEKAFGW